MLLVEGARSDWEEKGGFISILLRSLNVLQKAVESNTFEVGGREKGNIQQRSTLRNPKAPDGAVGLLAKCRDKYMG